MAQKYHVQGDDHKTRVQEVCNGGESAAFKLCNTILPRECKPAGGVLSVSPVIVHQLARRRRLRLEKLLWLRWLQRRRSVFRMPHALRCRQRAVTRRAHLNQPAFTKWRGQGCVRCRAAGQTCQAAGHRRRRVVSAASLTEHWRSLAQF